MTRESWRNYLIPVFDEKIILRFPLLKIRVFIYLKELSQTSWDIGKFLLLYFSPWKYYYY